MYFSNFVCMAFWLKCFRPEPYKSKSVYFSASAWYTPPVPLQICSTCRDWCWAPWHLGWCLKDVPQGRPCHCGRSSCGTCSGDFHSPDLHHALYPSQPPASSSGVVAEESSLAAMEDTQVFPGAISDHLVYLIHAWNMTMYLNTHSEINQYGGNVQTPCICQKMLTYPCNIRQY